MIITKQTQKLSKRRRYKLQPTYLQSPTIKLKLHELIMTSTLDKRLRVIKLVCEDIVEFEKDFVHYEFNTFHFNFGVLFDDTREAKAENLIFCHFL